MSLVETEPSRGEWTIRSKTELAALKTAGTWFRHYRKIHLQLDGVDAATQREWETSINRYYNACGCGEGKFFVLLGFVAFCIISWPDTHYSITWKNAGFAFLYCMAGAALGKLFGKTLAWLKLRKRVSGMLEQLG